MQNFKAYFGKTKRPLVMLQILAAAIFLSGFIIFFYGHLLPVYTDSKAPAELSQMLQDFPRRERFTQWYQQLAQYETAHKRLTDLGRGLMALGLGISIGTIFLQLLPKTNGKRIGICIAVFWTLLWGIKFPLTVWYYSVRQSRFDYPTWGDSISIGIFQDCSAWILGFIISSIFLMLFMIRRRFPVSISFHRPTGSWEWVRVIGLWLWILLLLTCIIPSIEDGDEGMVFSCTAAIPVIFLVLSASQRGRTGQHVTSSTDASFSSLIEERLPVWEALSDFFLDTRLDDDDYQRIAEVLVSSPYSVKDIEDILRYEVYPVLIRNLRSIAGEWAGFDREWLRETIGSRLGKQPGFRLPSIQWWMIRGHWIKVSKLMLR